MSLFLVPKKRLDLLLIIGFAFNYINNGFAIEIIKKQNHIPIPKETSELEITKEIIISLEEIESLIANNNLELQSSKYKMEQSKYLLKSAISSWYPRLSLSSNGLPSYLDGATYNKPDSSTDTRSRQLKASVSAELKWDLINPLRKPEINSAKDEFDKSKLSYLIQLRDIKLQAIKEFYLLQQAIEELKVAKKSLEYSQLSLEESQIKLKAGVGTKLELLEAQTQLSRDEKMLSNKIGNKNIRQRAFTNILNLSSNTKATINVETKIIGTWDKTIEESILSAYKFRKDLDNIILDMSIYNNNANLASAGKKPTISIYNNLSGEFNQGQRLVSSPSMDNTSSAINNTVGINATWTLIDGGKAKSRKLYNQSKVKESRNQYQIKLKKIRKEVETSFFKLKTSEKNILTTYKEIKTAAESLRLANLRFKAGITTQREIVNQQRDLTEAKLNHVKSIANYNIHISELSRQTGINQIKSCNQTKNMKNNNFLLELKGKDLLAVCK
tara:strand:+ start:13345 stop:14844 length:1500 start_codon:yes stop_codon:yes gene_type:complete